MISSNKRDLTYIIHIFIAIYLPPQTDAGTKTTSVTSFIIKCIDDVVPTVTIRANPNQKPWITANMCTKIKARAS